jgi:hypothetical protein
MAIFLLEKIPRILASDVGHPPAVLSEQVLVHFYVATISAPPLWGNATDRQSLALPRPFDSESKRVIEVCRRDAPNLQSIKHHRRNSSSI